jgi:hypothetical protein
MPVRVRLVAFAFSAASASATSVGLVLAGTAPILGPLAGILYNPFAVDLQDLRNDLGFRMRAALRWSAPVWRLRRGSWQRMLRGLDAAGAQRARQLLACHGGAWPAQLEAQLDDWQWRENLYLLDLLERLLPSARGPGLEVGAKDGAMLPALQAAVRGLGIWSSSMRTAATWI